MSQTKIVNRALLHLCFSQLKLMNHLDTMRSIYFCSHGDVIDFFMDSIFKKDLNSGLKITSPQSIQDSLRLSFRMI